MSKKILSSTSKKGIIISTSSFVEQQYQQHQEEPGFIMYEIFRSLIRDRCRKPFQLLKQFILFSSEQSSIEANYKYMRYQLEMVEVSICSVCNRFKQKLLLDAFLTVKHKYQKQIRIEEAYYNQENIQYIHTSLLVVEQSYQRWLSLEFLTKLSQNYRNFKLSKISKIQSSNNDFTLKQLQDFQPLFNDKHVQIQQINSFLLEKDQEVEEHFYHKKERKTQIEKITMKERKEIEENQEKTARIQRSKNSVSNTPNRRIEKNHQRGSNQLEQKMFVTEKKQFDLPEQNSTHRIKPNLPEHDPQEIILIRDSSKKKGAPSSYLTIPVTSQKVKIVYVETEKKKKKKETIENRVSLTENSCANCKFCELANQRQQIMKKVSQRLEISNSSRTYQHQEQKLNLPHQRPFQRSKEMIRTKGRSFTQNEFRISQFNHDEPQESITERKYEVSNNELTERRQIAGSSSTNAVSLNTYTISFNNQNATEGQSKLVQFSKV